MLPYRKLRATALCIVTATYAGTWGCTESFSGPGFGMDAAVEGDDSVPLDSTADRSADGPAHDAIANDAVDPGADVAVDSPASSDGPAAADGADATLDAPDTAPTDDVAIALPDAAADAADAADANDAADVALTPSLTVTSNAVVGATCFGAAGTQPSQSAMLQMSNTTTHPVQWTVFAVNGSVTLQPSSGTLGAAPNGFGVMMASAQATSGYPPAASIIDMLVFASNDGHPNTIVPITVMFRGYHAAAAAVDFGPVAVDASAMQHVAVTYNGDCCPSASPDSTSPPFTAVSDRDGGIVDDIAITFRPTAAVTSTASFQFTGPSAVEVCSPPIVVTGTGQSGP